MASGSRGGTHGRGAGRRVALAMALGLGFGVALVAASGLVPRAVFASEAGIGLRAPACELTRLVASTSYVRSFVRSFEGRVTLVDFWASWCPTCEHAFGALNALARDYQTAGLDIVAVNLDANPQDALDFLVGRRVDFELARDATGRCPRGFGLVGMPQAFLVDASGRVQAVMRGFRASETQDLRARIEALLEGTRNALPAVASGPVETMPTVDHGASRAASRDAARLGAAGAAPR